MGKRHLSYEEKLFRIRIRFWFNVEKTDTCWIWTGAKSGGGYGSSYFDGRNRLAHHIAWFLTHGHFPEEPNIIMHKCDNPVCVNPDHLQIGTRKDNLRDMLIKKRNTITATLDYEKAIEIRQKRKMGASYQSLAEEYGVHYTTIQNVVRNETWIMLDTVDA